MNYFEEDHRKKGYEEFDFVDGMSVSDIKSEADTQTYKDSQNAVMVNNEYSVGGASGIDQHFRGLASERKLKTKSKDRRK